MLFSCVANGRIQDRFVDTSQQAVFSRHFPVSAGIRPQVDKLSFATKKSPGRFIIPENPYADGIDLFRKSLTRFLPKPIYHQSYVGDTVSLLYAPFYASERLYDAVLNQPATRTIPDDLAAILDNTETIQNETRFVPAICPSCGWDLEGEKDASVMVCKNCQTTWQPTRKGFTNLPFVHLTKLGDYPASLPFWRIRADVSGMALTTINDFTQLANLSGQFDNNKSQRPFYFWVPAFKVRPKMLITLCRRMTVAQPETKNEKQILPPGKILPANLPVTEAIDTLKIVLAELAKPAKIYFPLLDQITITPRKALLVYVPFDEDHHDFIQPKLHVGIGKRLVALAENL